MPFKSSSLPPTPHPPSPTDVRSCGINPNHWYVVARSCEVHSSPLAVTLWHQSIVLYRSSGKICALENRCPHRQVKLSHGQVKDDLLECTYHGWQFTSKGECAAVPYLASNQKLPSCKIRSYPVREQDGFIWLFPGDTSQADSLQPLGIPEWNHLNYVATVSTIECQAHYSFLVENLMDMYHGHLHQDWQAWSNPVLEQIQDDSTRVDAHYQAQSYYQIDRPWAILVLLFPALRRLHPEPLDVSYIYPHWVCTLGKDFKIYCLVCPISETATRAYLVQLTSLNAYWRLHKLPVWFRRWVKNRLFGIAQRFLDGLVRQDVQMLEEEQQAYLDNPKRHGVELNRAIASVQRLIKNQATSQHSL